MPLRGAADNAVPGIHSLAGILHLSMYHNQMLAQKGWSHFKHVLKIK